MTYRERLRPPHKLHLFLDSGAFATWIRGTAISLDDYIAYIKANRQHIAAYVTMDVMPGSPDTPPRPAQVEESAAQSYANHCKMKAEGLSPIPVFHRGEDFKWLHRYLDDGDPYIGLSPLWRAATSIVQPWLDRVFTQLTDNQGRALVKVHGFAITRIPIIFRYPWESVDSSGWIRAAAYGRVVVPRWSANKPDFTKPFTMNISDDRRGDKGSYASMMPAVKERYRRYFEETIGITVPDLCNDWAARARVNIHYLQQVEAMAQDVRFTHRTASFFNS